MERKKERKKKTDRQTDKYDLKFQSSYPAQNKYTKKQKVNNSSESSCIWFYFKSFANELSKCNTAIQHCQMCSIHKYTHFSHICFAIEKQKAVHMWQAKRTANYYANYRYCVFLIWFLKYAEAKFAYRINGFWGKKVQHISNIWTLHLIQKQWMQLLFRVCLFFTCLFGCLFVSCLFVCLFFSIQHLVPIILQ